MSVLTIAAATSAPHMQLSPSLIKSLGAGRLVPSASGRLPLELPSSRPGCQECPRRQVKTKGDTTVHPSLEHPYGWEGAVI